MMNYEQFYRQITSGIRGRKRPLRALPALNRLLTGLMYLAYPPLLAAILIREGRGQGRKALLNSDFLKCLLIPAGGFAAETALRAGINRPRPYETWKLDPLIHKDTRGKSFPSRHVFSSVIISMAYLFICPAAGAFFLAVSALTALLRVIGGVHYPSDVAAGYGLGAAWGLLFWTGKKRKSK